MRFPRKIDILLLHKTMRKILHCLVILYILGIVEKKWAGYVTRTEARRSAYSVLVGNPEGKGLLGRPRRRWDDNFKMGLREVGWWAWTGLI
jgi:hypothetical protein